MFKMSFISTPCLLVYVCSITGFTGPVNLYSRGLSRWPPPRYRLTVWIKVHPFFQLCRLPVVVLVAVFLEDQLDLV